MQSERIQIYTNFMDYIKFPMVLFEEGSGTLIYANYEAQKILGPNVSCVVIEPEKEHMEEILTDSLEQRKALLWYRIKLMADDRPYYVTGIIDPFTENDKEYCALIFESRGDLHHGSVTLERIVNHSDYVAIYLYADKQQWKVRYVSRNMSRYGYTSEQFYRGVVSISDLMSDEDYKQLRAEYVRREKNGEDDFSVFTYWVSEDRTRSYVRMDMHIDRDQLGRSIGLSFFVHDLSEQQRESEENEYLKSAIHKSKSVVLVKRYEGGKRYLRFVTPNVVTLGCNVEALRQGSRLSEDYIHPEDRESVLDAVYKTIADAASGQVLTYRMVGDDGFCRYVSSEITITHMSDTGADVEFLITDITEEKEYEKKLIQKQKDYEQEIDFIRKGYEANSEMFDAVAVLQDEFMEDLIESVVSITGLYSVLVDLEGNFITKPVGAMDHMGEFYDMFERPFYKDLYLKLNETIIQTREPVVMEMNDGYPDSRICGAPIMMDHRHVGTWIICAYSKEERDRLYSIYRAHWSLAERVSGYLYNEAVVAKEIERSRLSEYRLEQQLKRQNLITELLAMPKGANSHFVEICLERIGSYLAVDRLCYFLLNESDGSFMLKQEWSSGDIPESEKEPAVWRGTGDMELVSQLLSKDYLPLNTRQCSPSAKRIMAERGIKSALIVPMRRNGKLIGSLCCGEYHRSRMWTDSEIQFVQRVREILETQDVVDTDSKELQAVNTSLLETYDMFPIIMYIRDSRTGRIYYANRAANTAFGMDMEGFDSEQIVKSMTSQYERNPAMRKHFVYNKNITKWESYIKQLDKIMCVEEMNIQWYDGREAKLVVLKDKKQD